MTSGTEAGLWCCIRRAKEVSPPTTHPSTGGAPPASTSSEREPSREPRILGQAPFNHTWEACVQARRTLSSSPSQTREHPLSYIFLKIKRRCCITGLHYPRDTRGGSLSHGFILFLFIFLGRGREREHRGGAEGDGEAGGVERERIPSRLHA